MQAIVVPATGNSGVLKIKKVDEVAPKKDEVLIKHTAIGVNFFDICLRRAQYKLDKLPAVLGFEACGIIEKIGSAVTDFKVGDRVAYATAPNGAYAEKNVVHQHHLIIPPTELTDVEVAGSLAKGLMAHALLYRVYLAKRAKRLLVHAAAGGVGQFLCQFAKFMELEIIGTVGNDNKIDLAKKNGCNHVINYQKSDLVSELAKLTKAEGVGMVLDGVGKDTLLKSLRCLWPMGICVSFGEASGNCEALDLNTLVGNALYLTRPSLFLYKANRVELVMSANQVFEGLKRKILQPKITTYSFKDVAKAHDALEKRMSSGSLVLTL